MIITAEKIMSIISDKEKELWEEYQEVKEDYRRAQQKGDTINASIYRDLTEYYRAKWVAIYGIIEILNKKDEEEANKLIPEMEDETCDLDIEM